MRYAFASLVLTATIVALTGTLIVNGPTSKTRRGDGTDAGAIARGYMAHRHAGELRRSSMTGGMLRSWW